MGNRLTKIYTRTGDEGTTGMADGSRVSKADLRFDAMGAIDLLNAQIGLLRGHLAPMLLTTSTEQLSNLSNIDTRLSRIQHQLFNLGGELAMPDYQGILPRYVEELEQQIDAWNAHLPVLKDFILPAGSIATSQAHIARCYCRDAERVLVALQLKDGNVSSASRQFINRLSDWLFVLCRVIARADGGSEVLWQKQVMAN